MYTMQMAKGKKINHSLVSCQGGVAKTCIETKKNIDVIK